MLYLTQSTVYSRYCNDFTPYQKHRLFYRKWRLHWQVTSAWKVEARRTTLWFHSLASLNQNGTYCIDLIESFPLLILDAQRVCSLDGSLHVAGPHLQVLNFLTLDESLQSSGILETRNWACQVKSILYPIEVISRHSAHWIVQEAHQVTKPDACEKLAAESSKVSLSGRNLKQNPGSEDRG